MQRLWLAVVVGFLIIPKPGWGVTADEALDAVGVPAADIQSATLSEGSPEMLETMSSQGTIAATYPPMALMFTGRASQVAQCQDHDLGGYGDAGDTVTIRLEVTPPAGMHSFKFNFYFLSREYPNYVNSDFNDTFTVTQQSSVYNGNIVFDQGGNVINVNSALFTVTNQALLTGTGFDCPDPYLGGMRGGGTGWLTTISPCVPGETFTLIFTIGDVFDGIYDSGVFIDGWEWREQEEDEPHAAEPISLRFLSPKVGPTQGGQVTVVYGNEFTEDCQVSFDGQEIGASEISLLSSERLEVVTPSHSEGMVDVRVWSEVFDDTLVGGYTYSDADLGSMPPELVEIDPNIGPLEGGIRVKVFGGNLDPDTAVYFDGAEAACTINQPGTEAACDLPAYDGSENEAVVIVEAINPSGAEAMPPLTFTYSSTVVTDGGPSGDEDGCDCDASGRRTAPFGALLLLLVALAAVRRMEV